MVLISMPRKPKKATAGKRVQEFSSSELESILSEWGVYAAKLQAVADQMKENGVRAIEIDGRDTPERIRDEMIRFCRNARDGLTKLEFGR